MTDPLCETLTVVAISHADALTKGTVDQIKRNNAAIDAVCGKKP